MGSKATEASHQAMLREAPDLHVVNSDRPIQNIGALDSLVPRPTQAFCFGFRHKSGL